MKFAVSAGAIFLGVLLLGLSTVWTSFSSAESGWTDKKAQRSAEVQSSIPVLAGKAKAAKGPAAATLKAELDALKKENEQLNAEFNSAANSPKAMSKILKWTGISLAVLGLIGWYAAKQSS
jgi:hypothetical protein